jgi:DNA topoisomerase I
LLLKNNKDGRKLGMDPVSGKPIFARVGRFGPMVQIGESDSSEKPKYASLLSNQNISTLTLEDALKLFELPRDIGEYQEKVVTIAVGRFGPYIKHDSKFTSLKKTDNPLSITLERAIELIDAKRESDSKKLIKSFPENKDVLVIKDRWGKPSIKYKTKYLRIPKDVQPEKLTLEKCLEIIHLEIKPEKTKKVAAAKKVAKPKKAAKSKK